MRCPRSDVKFTEFSPAELDLGFSGGLAAMPALYQQILAGLARSIVESNPRGRVISVSGSQGSGKSTLSAYLVDLLHERYGVTSALLSLDDFYLTRQQRAELAENVHPLLRTRGVPGTHAAALMQQSVSELRSGGTALVPRFDKSSDDRFPEPEPVGPVDLVVCEGWCWGAAPQPAAALDNPLNALEREQDPDGAWRRYVNTQLDGYQSLFATDAHIHLQVPSMDVVYAWRWQQEQDLQKTGTGSRIMSESEVRAFIAYYERLTRWMLETMPARADVLITLGEDHGIRQVRYR
jgi:D-glycerate 3-kinase